MVEISSDRTGVNLCRTASPGRADLTMTDMAESAGILLRVSSDGQDEENQRPELEAHCGQRGYRINKTYQLYDKSAYKGEHDEALQEILSDIRSGYIKVIVIVHSSRIDRRDPDIAEFYHLSIKMAGGRIESVREPMFGKSDVSVTRSRGRSTKKRWRSTGISATPMPVSLTAGCTTLKRCSYG